MLTKDGRRTLHAAMRAGSKKARETLWIDSLRLVRRVNAQLRSAYGQDEGDEDWLQEGALAAGRAVDTWDPQRSSFASWVVTNVKGAMLDYINENGKAGIGSKSTAVTMVDMEEGVAFSPELSGTEDRPGSGHVDDGIPRSELLTYDGIQLGDDTEGEVQPPEGYEAPEDRVTGLQLREALGRLEPQDEAMLRAYYGIDCPRLTLEQLATRFTLSVSGIRKRITLLHVLVTHCLKSR
jgi:RNA polymerase sigma factor (sigma-70 family)